MPDHQERHLTEVQSLARGLRSDRATIREAHDELTQSLNELQELERHREPRANFEFTEDEVRFLLEKAGDDPVGERSEGDTAYFKLRTGLALESGPGGRFSGGHAA